MELYPRQVGLQAGVAFHGEPHAAVAEPVHGGVHPVAVAHHESAHGAGVDSHGRPHAAVVEPVHGEGLAGWQVWVGSHGKPHAAVAEIVHGLG